MMSQVVPRPEVENSMTLNHYNESFNSIRVLAKGLFGTVIEVYDTDDQVYRALKIVTTVIHCI